MTKDNAKIGYVGNVFCHYSENVNVHFGTQKNDASSTIIQSKDEVQENHTHLIEFMYTKNYRNQSKFALTFSLLLGECKHTSINRKFQCTQEVPKVCCSFLRALTISAFCNIMTN